MFYAVTSLPEEAKKGLVYVQNYTKQDFAMDYLDDTNTTHTITIPSLDYKSFPQPLADLVITHLANFILNLEDFSYKTDPKLEIKRIKEKIIFHE